MSGERIEPFRALLYNRGKCGDLAAVVAPPYDLIGPARQKELYERSPYNVVRLELGREPDRYGAAAALLGRWLHERVLERAAVPALYFYSQIFSLEGRRLRREGLVVRIRLEEFSRGRILPHERTFAAPKEDRLRLLSATETNLSSIFGLYSGAHPELESLREGLRQRPPMLELTDDLGILNQLRAIEAPAEIALIQRELADARVLIADGHHRYETALEYRRLRRAAEGNPAALQPYDYTMMTMVGCEDPGLVILPTHRVVGRLDPDAMARFDERAAELFRIEKFDEPAGLRAALKAAGRGAIAVALRGGRLRMLRLENYDAMAEAMPAAPPEVRELDVSLLHALVFERILRLEDSEVRAGGNIEYTIDAAAALEAVRSGRAEGAFLMNPPSIRDVERVSDAGATMPEKSTYFYPKLLTGLFMSPLSD